MAVPSIGQVPMRCVKCGYEAPLEECNINDPIGDGQIGCPLEDCGGEMRVLAHETFLGKVEAE